MRRGSRKPAPVQAAVALETVGVTVLPGVALPEWLEPVIATEPIQEAVVDVLPAGPGLDPSQIATMDASALMAAFAALQAQAGTAAIPAPATTGAQRSAFGADIGPTTAGREHELVGAGVVASGAGLAGGGTAGAGLGGSGIAPEWAAEGAITGAPGPGAAPRPPVESGFPPGSAAGAWGGRPVGATSGITSSHVGPVPGDSSLLAPSPFVTAPGGGSLGGASAGYPAAAAHGSSGGFTVATGASPGAMPTPASPAGAPVGYAGAPPGGAPVGYPGAPPGAPVGYPGAAGAPVGYAGAGLGYPAGPGAAVGYSGPPVAAPSGPVNYAASPAASPSPAVTDTPEPFDRSTGSPSGVHPGPNGRSSGFTPATTAAAVGVHGPIGVTAAAQAGVSPAAHATADTARGLPEVPGLTPEQVALAKRYLELLAAGQVTLEPAGSPTPVEASPRDAAVSSRRGSRRRKGLLVATTAALAAAGIVGGAWLAFPGLRLDGPPEPAAASALTMPASVNGLVALTDPSVGEAMVPLIGLGLRPSGVTVTAAYGTEPAGPIAMAAMATTVGSPADASGQVEAWAQRSGAEVETPVSGTGATEGITCAATAQFAPSGSFCVWSDGAVRGQTYVVGEPAQAALTRTADLRLAMAASAKPAT